MLNLRLQVVAGFFLISFFLLLMSSALLLSSCRQQIPLIERKCGTCHSATVVYQTRRTEEGWRQVVHGMKIRGMEITEEEEQQVFETLFRDFRL